MKIIFFAPASSVTDQIINSLKNNGALVVWQNDRANLIFPRSIAAHKLVWWLTRRIKPLKIISNRLMNRRVLDLAHQHKPDIFLTLKGTILKPVTIQSLKAMGVRTVNWFFESVNYPAYERWFLSNWHYYDIIVAIDRLVAQNYDGKTKTRVVFLPIAADPGVYGTDNMTPADYEKYQCDVSFVGALYPERLMALTAVVKAGFDLRIYGWSGWEKTPLAKYYHGPLSAREIGKASRAAKVAINMNVRPTGLTCSIRAFLLAAARACQISDNREALEGIFIDGQEILTFDTPQELCAVIRRCLDDEAFRQSIAEAGYQRFMRDHTMDARIKQLIKIIQ